MSAPRACRFFMQGNCQAGALCRFSHGAIARPQPCRFFQQGNCSFGTHCRYSHEAPAFTAGSPQALTGASLQASTDVASVTAELSALTLQDASVPASVPAPQDPRFSTPSRSSRSQQDSHMQTPSPSSSKPQVTPLNYFSDRLLACDEKGYKAAGVLALKRVDGVWHVLLGVEPKRDDQLMTLGGLLCYSLCLCFCLIFITPDFWSFDRLLQ